MYRFESNESLLADLSEAMEIARSAHEGQIDKAGKPYFEHLQAVCTIASNMIHSWDEPRDAFLIQAKIVSYLHDVIEDTKFTLDDLWDCRIQTDCILAIEVMTKECHQDYSDYLSRVKSNKLATVVKIADLTHNSDLSRLGEVTPEDLDRRDKYLKAIAYLSNLPE